MTSAPAPADPRRGPHRQGTGPSREQSLEEMRAPEAAVALRMRNRNRSLVFVAVAGAHAVILGVLIGSSRRIGLPSWTGVPVTAFVLRAVRRRAPVARPRLDEIPTRLSLIAEPITPASPPLPVQGPSGSAIDWHAAAREAAAAVLERKKRISFGFPAGGTSALTLGVPFPYSPAHHAGESERTGTGEVIEWTSGAVLRDLRPALARGT